MAPNKLFVLLKFFYDYENTDYWEDQTRGSWKYCETTPFTKKFVRVKAGTFKRMFTILFFIKYLASAA